MIICKSIPAAGREFAITSISYTELSFVILINVLLFLELIKAKVKVPYVACCVYSEKFQSNFISPRP